METFERNIILQRIEWPSNAPHPPCAACGELIVGGEMVSRVITGPGASPVDRERCQAGLPFEASWVWAHWACITGDVDNEHEERERVQVLERIRLGPDRDAILQCHACNGRIVGGQSFALVSVGPGDDVATRAAAFAGQVYDAVAVPVHWSCATGDAEPERMDCVLCRKPLDESKACSNPGCSLNPNR